MEEETKKASLVLNTAVSRSKERKGVGNRCLRLSLTFYFGYIFKAGLMRKMLRLMRKHDYLLNDICLKFTLDNSIFSSIIALKKPYASLHKV